MERLRSNAADKEDIFYTSVGQELWGQIKNVFAKSPNANLEHIINDTVEHWQDEKVLLTLEETARVLDVALSQTK